MDKWLDLLSSKKVQITLTQCLEGGCGGRSPKAAVLFSQSISFNYQSAWQRYSECYKISFNSNRGNWTSFERLDWSWWEIEILEISLSHSVRRNVLKMKKCVVCYFYLLFDNKVFKIYTFSPCILTNQNLKILWNSHLLLCIITTRTYYIRGKTVTPLISWFQTDN